MKLNLARIFLRTNPDSPKDPNEILRESRNLIQRGQHRRALSLLDESGHEGEILQKFLETKATALIALGDHESGLECLSKAAKAAHPNRWNWRLTRTPIRELKLQGEQLDEFWKSCMGPLDQSFESAKQNVLSGQPSLASLAVRDSTITYLSNHSLEVLDEIFLILSQKDFDYQKPSDEDFPVPIFIMGTGWSGTSAIYDYVCEFKNVTGVQGEPPFFARGGNTMHDIKKSVGDNELIRILFINFIFEKLIGYGKPSGQNMTNFSYARRLWNSQNQASHFLKVKDFALIGKGLWSNAKLETKRRLTGRLANELIEGFILRRKISKEEVLIFRNPIPAQYIDAVTVFERSKVVVSLRDPRATFATMRQTEGWFTDSAQNWSRQLKRWRTQMVQKSTLIIQQNPEHQISFAQFEEFVISQKFREDLANRLGLETSEKDEYSRFKPWESIANVLVHEKHRPKSEMRVIEQELPEYCIEIGVRALKF